MSGSEQIEKARQEGFAAGIEAAAKVALSLMHGNPTDGFEVGYDNACENIAKAIRALQPVETPSPASSDAMREAVERFIADYDDADRADAGAHPLMLAHVADFRATLAGDPS